MTMLSVRRKIVDFFSCIVILCVAAGLCIFPEEMVSSAKDGLYLCFNVIIPSLFPFFVISALVVRLGWAKKLGLLLSPLMKPLFNVGGACASALVLGFIGGYPVGAKTVIELYNSKACSKAEAERMLAFCNNSGPAFILGVVGAGIFASGRAGLLLYLAHALASVLIGIIFRKWGSSVSAVNIIDKSTVTASFAPAFVDSIKTSFSSVLNISGFVVFFTVFIKLLFLSGAMAFLTGGIGAIFSPLGLNAQWAETLITGLIELSSGVWSLRDAVYDVGVSMAMAAFMLGWAGLSVHCQVLSFIGDSGLTVKTYILGKLLHGLLSAGLTIILASFFPLDQPVAVCLAQQISDIAGLDIEAVISMSISAAAAVFCIFAAVFLISSKKSGKQKKKAL